MGRSPLSQSGIISRAIDSLVNSGMATRCNEVNSFLTSSEEQVRRLARWNEFAFEIQRVSHNTAYGGGTAPRFQPGSVLPFQRCDFR